MISSGQFNELLMNELSKSKKDFKKLARNCTQIYIDFKRIICLGTKSVQWRELTISANKYSGQFTCDCEMLVRDQDPCIPPWSQYLYFSSITVAPHSNGHGEFSHEHRQGAKFARKHKVKQRPQFSQVVLHGWAREDDAVTSAKLLTQKMKALNIY